MDGLLELGNPCLDGVANQPGLVVDVQLGHHVVPVDMDGVDGPASTAAESQGARQ